MSAARWINAGLNWGYILDNPRPIKGWFGREKMVYRFVLNPDHPLTLVLADGTRIRPCASFVSDQGSEPIFVQGWLPKDRHPAYYLHDDQYRAGGAWIAAPGSTVYLWTVLTRRRADDLLRLGLTSPDDMGDIVPVSHAKATAIWAGVRLGAAVDAIVPFKRPLFHPWRSGRPGTAELFPLADKPDVDDPVPMGVG